MIREWQKSFIDLTSGYISGKDQLPKQGTERWKLHQNYFRDWLSLRASRITAKSFSTVRSSSIALLSGRPAKRKRTASTYKDTARHILSGHSAGEPPEYSTDTQSSLAQDRTRPTMAVGLAKKAPASLLMISTLSRCRKHNA